MLGSMTPMDEYAARLQDEQSLRDEQAEAYESGISAYQHELEIEQYLLALSVTGSDVILDAGGGTGRVARAMARAARIVVIADLSHQSLRVARDRSRLVHLDVYCVQCDLARPPFRNHAFAKVLISEVLEHIPDRRDRVAILGSLSRLVASNGHLVLSVYNKHLKHRLRGITERRIGRNCDRYFTAREVRDEILEACTSDRVRCKAIKVLPMLTLTHFGIGARLGRLGGILDRLIARCPGLGQAVGSLLLCDVELDCHY
jgi:demethylmenaquinone methyltransferase/2-methoxy-6-polyprenyl-1,4-benzoquinol methylase